MNYRTIGKRCSWITLSAAVAALGPWPAQGLGFRIPNQDAEAIGRGNAFVATANNPSALYYNPAGISQLEGQQLQVGLLSYLGITSNYRAPGGARAKTKYEIQPVPQFYFTSSPSNSPLSFGLGLYAPFGLGLKWPADSGFRTLAEEGRLLYLSANPVLAWQVRPNLSLAAGLMFNYSHVKLRQGMGFFPGDEFKFIGEDFDLGFNLGTLWQPHEQWSLGLNYRSATSMSYHGRTAVSFIPGRASSTARINFPQTLVGGVSFRPTKDWNLEFNVDWTDWDTLKTVTFRNTAFGDVPRTFHWRSSFFYEFGVTRHLPKGYYLSAGYFFSGNSTSTKYFNPTVPDTDLHVASLGGGYKGPHWSWGLAGQIITGPWRTVAGSPRSAVGESADGRYRFFIPALTFSIGHRF